MVTHEVFGVPIGVDCVSFDSEGNLDGYNAYIGDVEITATCPIDDILKPDVVAILEALIEQHARAMHRGYLIDAAECRAMGVV